MQLYTIGFTQKSLRQFIGLLRGAQVDGIVDVRLNNTSQLAGYAKRDDLAFVLELCGIGYLEEKQLAPTQPLLDAYHRDHDWPAYEKQFQSLLAERPLEDVMTAVYQHFERPCLLCAEPEPTHCHRRLVAEAFAHLRPDLQVQHLVLPKHGAGASDTDNVKSQDKPQARSAGRKRSRKAATRGEAAQQEAQQEARA